MHSRVRESFNILLSSSRMQFALERVDHCRLGFQKKLVSTVESCDRPPCVFSQQPKPLGSCHKHAIANMGSEEHYYHIERAFT